MSNNVGQEMLKALGENHYLKQKLEQVFTSYLASSSEPQQVQMVTNRYMDNDETISLYFPYVEHTLLHTGG